MSSQNGCALFSGDRPKFGVPFCFPSNTTNTRVASNKDIPKGGFGWAMQSSPKKTQNQAFESARQSILSQVQGHEPTQPAESIDILSMYQHPDIETSETCLLRPELLTRPCLRLPAPVQIRCDLPHARTFGLRAFQRLASRGQCGKLTLDVTGSCGGWGGGRGEGAQISPN